MVGKKLAGFSRQGEGRRKIAILSNICVVDLSKNIFSFFGTKCGHVVKGQFSTINWSYSQKNTTRDRI